jgi:DNA-binding CsgD family transcriptional regulator
MPGTGTSMQQHPKVGALLGRAGECQLIEGFLAGPRPAMLVMDGEAGIGKTTLWRYGVQRCAAVGRLVLEFRPGEAEQALTFAGLAGLFPDPLLDEVLPGLPEPRRRALEAALLRVHEPSGPPGPATLGLGVLSVLRALAARSPVVIAIDDVQWLDEPSSRVLEFALRRVGTVDIGVLATRRAELPGTGTAPLEPAIPAEHRQRIVVGPLPAGVLGRVIGDRLGLTLPRLLASRLQQQSGGNPFVALELVRAAVARQAMPAPSEPFPIPADLVSLVGDRIAELPPEAAQALRMLAAMAHPTRALLARGIGAEMAERALHELAARELVTDGVSVRCAHPLIASAALATMLPTERRRMHHKLAAITGDVEERARHLALAASRPRLRVAAALDDAARLARRRGASDGAAELARLAALATPPDDVDELARRELILAQHLLDAGSPADARDAAARAVARLAPGPGRVDALIQLAKIEGDTLVVGSRGAMFLQALDEARGDRAALVRAHVAAGHWGDFPGGEGATEEAHARAAIDLLAGHEDDDPGSSATALLMLVEAGFRAGRGIDRGLLARAIALESQADLAIVDRPSTQGAIGLGLAGLHSESIKATLACLAQAEAEGDWSVRPILLRALAWTAWCAGDLLRAAAWIGQAIDVAGEIGLDDGVIWAYAAQIEASMGAIEAARDHSRMAIARGVETRSWWWEIRGHAATVFLGLTTGDTALAASAADHTLALAARAGTEYEPGWNRIHGDVAEALISVRRLDHAEDIVSWFESRAAISRHPWSLLASARSRALLEAARGRKDSALAITDRSLAEDTTGDMALERARTLLVRGQVLRSLDRRLAARDVFAQSQRVFEAAGAAPWAERARCELGRVSGRAPSQGELTPMERRTAELASTGRSNQEIADELMLSVRTVESQLSAAYRKLGVRSRAALATALRAGTSGTSS